MKHIRLEVEDELHKSVKVYAALHGLTIQEVCIKALEKFIKEDGEEKKE